MFTSLRRLFLHKIHVAAVVVCLAGGGIASLSAGIPCTVINMTGSVFISSADKSIKTTLKKGALISEGDSLHVGFGNKVQMSFDSKHENVTRVDGNAEVGFSFKKGVRMDLEDGKVYALLDHGSALGNFEVGSSSALIVGREGYYQVDVMGSRTKVTSYKGEVKVYNKPSGGGKYGAPQTVKPGQFTIVSGKQFLFTRPQTLNKNEFEAINRVIGGFETAGKESLSYAEIMAAHHGVEKAKPKDSFRNQLKKAKEGFLVY